MVKVTSKRLRETIRCKLVPAGAPDFLGFPHFSPQRTKLQGTLGNTNHVGLHSHFGSLVGLSFELLFRARPTSHGQCRDVGSIAILATLP